VSDTDEQPNRYCLALTGGIACGKSTVAAMLAQMGLTRVDSDQVARQVVEPGTPGLDGVVKLFGEGLLLADGTLDRRALGQLVFASTDARRQLESLLHPLIWLNLAAEMKAAAQFARETVFEIPLLYENGNQGRFSCVWVVAASTEVQLSRLMERDRWNRVEAESRLASQMSLTEKVRRADFVLVNDGNLPDLEARVRQGLTLWRQSRDGAAAC
jgi:dephospho-CoA kinase